MKVYNNLSNQKETFTPFQDNLVTIYVCGMTVQDRPHIGHIKSFLTTDVMRRYFEYKGYQVKLVQNFTDVDDKIINKANQEATDYLTVANRYIDEYFEVADKLNIMRADVYPRATEHIEEIINLIQRLIDKGVAYEADGDVYFSVESYSEYGKLSNRSVDDMQAGTRKDVQSNKRHPLDFALWKSAKPEEPHWDSPFGKGRPGWHIECSAMSMKYLGETFDIHAGGQDLIFPHHENEIAQSEAATGKPFARFWCETGLLEVESMATKKVEKMSKSLGNFFAMADILSLFEPDAVRMFLLSGHYRSPLNFSEERMKEAANRLDRLRNMIRNVDFVLQGFDDDTLPEECAEDAKDIYDKVLKIQENFEAAMDDDFNTAQAIATLFDLTKAINLFLTSRKDDFALMDKQLLAYARQQLQKYLSVLGFSEAVFAVTGAEEDVTADLIQILLDVRRQARETKQWAIADTIRDRLDELGLILEDRPGGETLWKWK